MLVCIKGCILLLLLTTSLVKTDAPALATTVAVNEDSVFRNFVNDLQMLKDAVEQRDIKKAGSFFNFPVIDENNGIWYIALSKEELQAKKLKNATPFTKKNFNRYFDKLFPAAFTKLLLEVNAEKLYKGQEQETSEFREGASSYRIYARYDRTRNTLTLNMATRNLIKEEGMEMVDGNAIYYFDILPDGHFQFKYIRIAG